MSEAKKSPPKSIYGGPDGCGKTGFFKHCLTVGDLKRELAKVPDVVPLNPDQSLPIWFNVGEDWPGITGEHVSFADPEDWQED